MHEDRLARKWPPRFHPPAGGNRRDFLATARGGRAAVSASAARWVTRLAQFELLRAEERRILIDVAAANRQRYTEHLQKTGDRIDRIFVLLEGVVCQYKLLPD